MAANNNGLSASGGGVVVLTYQLFITFGAYRQVGCFLFPACGKPKSVSTNLRPTTVDDKMTRLFSFIFCLLSTLTLSAQTFKLTDTVFNVGDVFIISNDFIFNYGKPTGRELDTVVRFLKNNPALIIEVGGHSDDTGTEERKMEMSLLKAQAVTGYLIGNGISEDRLVLKGYADANPIVPHLNPDGSVNRESKKINNRVELKILRLEPSHFKLTDTMFNVGDVYIARGIYFNYDYYGFRKESMVYLDSIVNFMNKNVRLVVEIGGHSDSRGSDEYNFDLSKRRADAVFRYLVNKNISEKRLTAVGYGETKPIALNVTLEGYDDPDGRQKNRRIELKILKVD